MTASFSSEVSLSELSEDVLRLAAEIGWCTMATVDRRDRPRSRVMHVNWQVDKGRLLGWAATGRTPIKMDHLTHNPHVSCAYWSDSHAATFIDCTAAWTEDQEVKYQAFKLIEEEAAERGFDARAMWPEGARDPVFEVLELKAWRAQVTLPDMAAGQTVASSRVWHRSPPPLDHYTKQ